MDVATATCARCQRHFVPRFRFQTETRDGALAHYCSQVCREPGLTGNWVACSRCGAIFRPQLASQVSIHGGERRYFCGAECRDGDVIGAPPPVAGALTTPGEQQPLPKDMREMRDYSAVSTQAPSQTTPVVAPAGPFRKHRAHALQTPDDDVIPTSAADGATSPGKPSKARAIAVLNQKGGTAKTTTALALAAGFAELGHRTLIVDLDPQGNIGVSVGVTSPRTVYHMVVDGLGPGVCAAPVRGQLYAITADEGLAAAEITLARMDERTRATRLQEAMQSLRGFDYVIFDCAPALSILNHNALLYAGEVLIPVSCDYLSLVGLKQVLRTLRRVTEQNGRPIRIAGVLPTFFDVRNKLSLEALTYLRKTFGSRALPPVRVNTKLAEAPSKRKTIFEHAPDSHGARDYMRVVEWLRTGEGATAVTYAA